MDLQTHNITKSKDVLFFKNSNKYVLVPCNNDVSVHLPTSKNEGEDDNVSKSSEESSTSFTDVRTLNSRGSDDDDTETDDFDKTYTTNICFAAGTE